MRLPLHLLPGLLALCSITACGDPSRERPAARPDACNVVPVEPGVLASMSRQPCHGSCPVYEFTIYEDGRMEYLGWGYVKTRNRASTQLDAATLDAVRRAFRDAAFFSLGDYARRKGDQTDGPGIMLYYAAEGRACLVKHYLRTSRLPPPQLDVLEATLEALVGIEGFIGTPEERRALNE